MSPPLYISVLSSKNLYCTAIYLCKDTIFFLVFVILSAFFCRALYNKRIFKVLQKPFCDTFCLWRGKKFCFCGSYELF